MSGVRMLLPVALATCLAGVAGCGDNPTAPTATVDEAITTPQTVSFSGVVGASGSASRTFTARLSGVAVASLGGIAPATALVVGLGIPRADGTGCLLARSAPATDGAAARVTAAVDAGKFCVQVFAPANGPEAVAFTVILEHP